MDFKQLHNMEEPKIIKSEPFIIETPVENSCDNKECPRNTKRSSAERARKCRERLKDDPTRLMEHKKKKREQNKLYKIKLKLSLAGNKDLQKEYKAKARTLKQASRARIKAAETEITEDYVNKHECVTATVKMENTTETSIKSEKLGEDFNIDACNPENTTESWIKSEKLGEFL